MTSEDEHFRSQPGLLAKLDNAKILEQLLKVLQFKDEVQITATSRGLKITAEVSKSFFGSAFIQKETFSEYQINRPADHDDNDDDYEMEFNISLFTLVQCLNVTGSGTGTGSGGGATTMSTLGSTVTFSGGRGGGVSPSLLLHYPETGQPLYLFLEEAGGVVTKATIPTLDLDRVDHVDFAAMMEQNNTQIVARIILMAEHLCTILSEFDTKSDTLELSACPQTKTLTMSTSSAVVSSYSVEVPFDSDIVNAFQVNHAVSAKYQFSLLKYALKPMAMAEKVSIRFDSRSFLSVQYMIKINTDTTCFMEFYCAPEIGDEH